MNIDSLTFKDYDYKCWHGLFHYYYKQYLIRMVPLSLIFTTIFYIINPIRTASNSDINNNLLLFICINFAVIVTALLFGHTFKDVIFEMDLDRTIPESDYIKIFKKYGYKLLTKQNSKLKFRKFIWLYYLNLPGYIEFMDKTIMIRAETTVVDLIEEEIMKLQYENKSGD